MVHIIASRPKTRRYLVAIYLAVVLLAVPLSSLSHASVYSVAGYGNSANGINARGVYGWTNTMRNPIIYDKHVCSLYVWQDPDGWNMVELGHKRQVGWNSARYFWAIEIDGVYFPLASDPWDRNLGANSPDGSDHYYHLYRDHSVGGGQWQWYFLIDNQHVWSLNVWLYTGFALGACERNDTRDDNWGHHWNLKKMSNNSGQWQDWTNGRYYQDNDRGYRYQKNSDTDFFIQRG